MDIPEIEKCIKEIKSIKHRLEKLEEDNTKIEVRVFSENGWSNIDFKPKNISIKNMVIYQIKMDLQNELKKQILILKNITK